MSIVVVKNYTILRKMNFFSGEHIKEDLTESQFEKLCLEIFRFQARENPVYSEYIRYLGVNPVAVQAINEIPFLPIEFFKYHKVVSRYYKLPDNQFVLFRSSGTTGMQRSTHYIYNISLYEKSFFLGFRLFYGDPEDYTILALLPSYLERRDSSLIYMVKGLIQASQQEESGFYLYNYEELRDTVLSLRDRGKKILLIGVTFALLEFAEKYEINGADMIVMETGGMKGRKKEMVREELHVLLQQAFGVDSIHSEYGMTELLSQAYSRGKGIFHTPPWMRVLVRDLNDPFTYVERGRSGGINVIDLANVYSCAFIETKDIGRVNKDGSFTVLGRFDNSDLRGCNFLVV